MLNIILREAESLLLFLFFPFVILFLGLVFTCAFVSQESRIFVDDDLFRHLVNDRALDVFKGVITAANVSQLKSSNRVIFNDLDEIIKHLDVLYK